MVRASTVRDDVGLGLLPVVSHSGLAGRLACLFAVAVLLCVSSAHSQVIEEGGFPVKGGGVSGESFSLSCPPRLVVEAGESVALSCSATGVPEEGVRYGWESLSGEGFYLLSASDELSPLLTAPLSGAGEEYAYRLTAIAAGVYRTATVTVTVEGVPGETVGAPVVREECDSFTVPDELGEGCVEDKGPAPFGFGSEGEGGFLFPEAPGLPDRPSGPVRGGGSVMQAPPRLECPAAIFLEELETGSIECRVFDASGEEHLEYAWEPVGSTTRDYLENPRLIPEDSPTPSVVAPEAPAYETLESFRSVETTFRYRYRLTATSRATGLSSRTEVEVFVSGSRPGVYCPLEVAVEEGATIALDCEGVDPLSGRMDYDEDGASIAWEWEGLWGASTALLDATDRSSPLFTAPPGSAGKSYYYIASMTSQASGVSRTARRRVTVTVTEAGEEAVVGAVAGSDTAAPARGGPAADLQVTCADPAVYRSNNNYFYGVVETADDFELDCEATGGPDGAAYTYLWTHATELNRLSPATDIRNPVFDVPNVSGTYQVVFTLQAWARAGSITETTVVTTVVTVVVAVVAEPVTFFSVVGEYFVDEGDPSFRMDIISVGIDRIGFSYSWSGTPEALALLNSRSLFRPSFTAPGDVHEDTQYEYVFTATKGSPRTNQTVTVTVRDVPAVPAISCSNADVFEDADNFELDCSVTNANGATYSWEALSGATDTSLLTGTDGPAPTFDVPTINAGTPADAVRTYEYGVTMSATGGSVSATVTITVRDKDVLCWVSETGKIQDLYEHTVDEGSEDRVLETCQGGVTGPGGPPYTYEWGFQGSSALGSAASLLTATDRQTVYFKVPGDVPRNTEYEISFKVFSASNPGNSDDTLFRITVLNLDPVSCNDHPVQVLEGSAPFALECEDTGVLSGVTWNWDPTTHLTDTGTVAPTFTPPEIDGGVEEFSYRVRALVSGVDMGGSEVTVDVLDRPRIFVTCPMELYEPYEGAGEITLNCSATGGVAGATYNYVWTPRGSTVVPGKLSSAAIRNPTFAVPENVSSPETYEYTLTASSMDGMREKDGAFDVTVTVLDKPDIAIDCPGDPYSKYEGEEDFELDCSATGAPEGSDYSYAWTARGMTANTDNLIGGTDGPTPMFAVPEEVDAVETYEYLLTVSADNADSATEDVTVTVLNKADITVACPGDPYGKYEGEDDFDLDCSAMGAPSGSTYRYVWTGRGGTPDTDKLIGGTDGPAPTFDVPENVDSDEPYYYTLTVSAGEDTKDDAFDVTVTVLDRPAIVVTCPGDPYGPYEGADDIVLDCEATGGPSGSTYDYVWTERGGTADTALLIAGTDGPTPTFDVPESVDSNEPYYYTLTVSAENAEDGAFDVTVTVLDKPSITVTCPGNPYSKYEGEEDFDLDCSASGAPEDSDYVYEWTPRGGTANTDLLIAGTDGPTPTFDVPESVDSNEPYEYLLTVSAENAESATAPVTVRVLNRATLALVCTPVTPVYEGAPDFDLSCSATGAPEGSGYDYVWTPRGMTTNTDLLIAGTDGPTPTFDVPESVDADTDYEYTLTVSARGADPGTANVTVQVLKKPSLVLVCTPVAPVYEGAPDFDLNCAASGAPVGSTYDYVWTPRGSTAVPGRLSSTTIAKPTFDVPEEVAGDETYEYTLTASAENAEDATAEVTVRVLNKPSLALVCTPVAPVYEGAADFDLNCSASGAPSGSVPVYVWTARGSTVVPGQLSSTTVANPTFDVPGEVAADTDYEYTLTVSAENAEDAVEDVTVTVLNTRTLEVVCATPSPVYEGAADFALDCAATGAPAGSDYAYVWTARGATANTDLLVSGTDGPTPTFDVPEEVDEDETYEYLLRVSAENATDATAEVTVTVLKLGSIALVCASSPLVYEGSADFALNCSILGDTGDADYTYVWTARGATPNTDLLISGADGSTPTFAVPDRLDETTTYEYLLTASAANAIDATAEVTVTVLNRGALDVACAPPALVYEGAEDFDLDCTASGAPSGSEYAYVWTARGATSNTDLLIAGTDGPAPTFDVPDRLDATTTYEYLLTVGAENAESASGEVTVTVLNHGALSVVCVDPPSVYEGSADITLDCSASGAPAGSGYEYVWTARGSTSNTDLLIAGADGPTPTFAVPDRLDATTTYEYLLTVGAENAESASGEVTVTVLNYGALRVICADPPSVYEGSDDFALDCTASGAPAGSAYEYAWTARGSTANTDLLTDMTLLTPTFLVPDDLPATTTYEYLLTVSAANAEGASAEASVTVLNVGSLRVACADPPSVYEGSEDFALDCSASGAPAGSGYAYAWTARGSTANTDQLSAADIPSPTFYVPEDLDATTTYEYLLTASADNTISATAEASVTVLNRGPLSVVCTDPPSIYEGSEDFELDCSASGAPSGSDYAYAWTARGSTANTDQLSAADIPSPTFYVPDELDATTTYEYLLTTSAENAEDGTAEVSVTVLDKGALALVCTDVYEAYEGSADFELDCSASGAPSGSNYTYVWTARGGTANTDLLTSGTDGPAPTFAVPYEVNENGETYEYLLTASAANAEDASAEVTVNVLNREALGVACADPGSVYEGSADITLDCSASGAPEGSDYEYVWTARGGTAETDLLSATDGPAPTFLVPDEVEEDETYEYLLTVSAANAEDASAEVTVTVLDKEALALACADPGSVYEGSEDIAFDCTASGAPEGSDYEYAWTARGSTADTDQLSAADIPSPTFYVPEELDATTTYEYLLTASADNTISATAEAAVTVLNRGPLSVVCTDPPSIYEGSADFELDCSASGAPSGSDYAYAWTARGSTANTDQLSAADIPSPTFYVPDELDATTTYEYLLTTSAENAEDGTAEVSVTVLDKGALALVCTDVYEAYEGSADFELDCSASGAPAGSAYTYAWTASGSTANTDLLTSGTDGPAPTFAVPYEVDENGETYEYLLTASAENAEDASAEVTVNVLDGLPLVFVDDAIAGRVYVFTVGETIADILLPEATGGLSPYTYTLEPVLPLGLSLEVDGDPTRTISGTPLEVSPRSEYAWQVTDAKAETAQIAFFIEVAPAEEPPPAPVAEASSLGVTASASSLRFGVQSAATVVSLDPMTDGISTRVSGPYHAGRMTLSPGSSEEVDENGEMALSIELASPVALRRKGGVEAASIVLAPSWSLAESCEQLSSQTIGGLYTETTLADTDCRLLRFGGELDLTDVLPGEYAGSLDVVLRSGENEETHSVEVDVTVVPAQRVITIGPGGVRFSTSRELPVGLTEEQNLSIYPDVAFLTREKPHGAFELSNPSLIPLEVSVSARFGYTEATADGREVVVEDASGSHLGDLSQVVDIRPGVLVLMPGEKGLVRYGVQEGALAAMAEQGYAAFFDVVSSPRQYVRSDRMPEEVAGDRTARVTMRVPGVYVPAEGASQLRATLVSISFVGSPSATFLVETEDRPFAGEVVAYDGDGRELGRRETLVYTRSRVRIPLDRLPEEDAVFLRFMPRGSGRVPEPASIEWDAPRRDIGAAQDKKQTPGSAAIAGKP